MPIKKRKSRGGATQAELERQVEKLDRELQPFENMLPTQWHRTLFLQFSNSLMNANPFISASSVIAEFKSLLYFLDHNPHQ